MLGAGALTSLVLALLLAARLPAIGRPLSPPGRLLTLWGLWSGYVEECRLLSVVTVNKSSNKTSQFMDPEQSTLKKNLISPGVRHNNPTGGRNYKCFKTKKSETTRRETDSYKHQQKLLRNNILNILMNQNKPQQKADESKKPQISKKWIGSRKISSTETNAELTEKARKILKLGKAENTEISQHKMNTNLLNEFKIVKKTTANKIKQQQRKFFDGSRIFNKCFGIKLLLINTTFFTANFLLTVDGECFRKNPKVLESILLLNLIKNQIANGSSQNQTKIMRKEKNKCPNERELAFVKQKELVEKSSNTWDWQRIGATNRDQYKILTGARKVLIGVKKKSQHTELQKYGHLHKEVQDITGSLNSIPSGIITWKRKSERMSTKPFSKKQNILNSMKQRSIGFQKAQLSMKDIGDVYTTTKSYKNNGSIDLFNNLPEVAIKVMVQGKEQRTKTATPKSVDGNQRSSQAVILQKDKEYMQEKWPVYKIDSSSPHERKQDFFKTKAFRRQKWNGNPAEVHTSEKESTMFSDEGIEYSSRDDHVEPTELNSVFPITKYAVRAKRALFKPEIGQAKSSRQVGEMVTHSMLTLWKVKQKYLSFFEKDLKVKARRAAVSNKHVNGIYKRFNKRNYLPIPLINPHKHTSQSVSDGEKGKPSAHGESVKLSVDFVNHLVSVLVAGATIVGIAFFVLGLAMFCLFYKRRQLFQFLKIIMKDEELPNKFVPIDSQHYKHVSLSQCFHVGKSQESSKKKTEATTATEGNTTDDFCSVTKTVMCDSTESEANFNMPNRSFTASSSTFSFTSSSSRSICDCLSDASTSHVSLSNDIFTGSLNSCSSSINTKERVIIPVTFQSSHSSWNDEENENSTKTFVQLRKARILKSRPQNNTVTSSPSNETLTVVKSSEDTTHLPISESAQRPMGNICKAHSPIH